MLKSVHEDGPRPKCFFTRSILPSYLDHTQIPRKKRPFATIHAQPVSHMLKVLLPADKAETLRTLLNKDENSGVLRYAAVYMKLENIVSGEFFMEYIKSSGSNIIMLSEGQTGQDNTFSLLEGVLCLEVDKATFERMGLEGKAIPTEGRKHVKARYAIELNLRLPSMVRGKKGFERILWAFRNVLDYRVKWLFYNLQSQTVGEGPIAAYSPQLRNHEHRFEEIKGVLVPHLQKTAAANDSNDLDSDEDEDYATDLLEWLTLVLMNSPRIRKDDNIDTALSRYAVPSSIHEPSVQDLVVLKWHGLIPSNFIQQILLSTLKAIGKDSWLAIQAQAFHGKAYVFLQNAEHTTTWEYED